MLPVVLIPGLLCTAELFTSQVAALWPYGPVMVASTLAGETMADIAAAILAAAPPRFALVGPSMGGYIGLEIMRQAPERVQKLALLDTSARPDTPQQTAQRHALLAQARQGDFAAVAARGLTAMLHPAHQQDAALRALNARMGQAVGLAGLERQLAAVIGRPDSRPDLPAIRVPTLVVVGANDAVTPPDQAEELAAAIAGARLVVIPECGHSATLEQPEAVNRALVEWVRA